MTLKLDENQQKAVEHFQGPALVIAGPGSGKTTVIKERILHLIREYNITPRQILALAFNREAAKEMEKRILSELASRSELPEIRTLHAFGLRVINEYYDRLKRKNKPEVWSSDPERTIKEEIRQLERNMANATVTIYKIESELTGKCYIGQTTNPKQRKREHFSFDDSSNPDLRQAMLSEGKEHFNFYPIDEVEGEHANRSEAQHIKHYKDCAVVKLLESEVEQLEKDEAEIYISIYKIESQKTGICYIVRSTDSERNAVEDFIDSSNDEIRNAIENEGTEHFTLEILHKEVCTAEASILVEHAINNASSRSRAVFNRNDPLKQRYSDQLMIELFCEHFNICYEEFLKHPSGIENLTAKIEDFEKIVDKVQKAKREIAVNFSNTNSIDDVVDSIIESIDDHVVRAFAEKYEKKKEKANAIDFQDMILYAVYLLEVYPDIYTRYRKKYDYVLIDEFQDISPIDFRLIKPLSENLFVVGDDDQAIYGFRGGNSEIMLNFHKRENVNKYKITRNYRSTSTIVEHSRTLIEHNSFRIDKNLHAENPIRPRIKILKTTQETVKSTFLREFAEPCCQTQFIDKRVPIIKNSLLKVSMQTQQTGIPARYRSEVEKIRKMLLDRGFKEVKIKRKEGDFFKFIGRGPEETIEGSTIHKMKGKEYDKVILIHNTLEDKDFPFRDSDDITEDRRVFYVGMTRAKRELVILGGECQFVSEAGLSALPSKRRKHLERISKALQSAIVKRIDIAKKQVNEVSEKLQIALTSTFIKHIESATESTRRQCEYELDRLRQKVHKTEKVAEDASRQLETELMTAIQASNENLLIGLIPVLDTFESQINNVTEKVEIYDLPADTAELHQSLRHAQQQLLDLLENHGLKPIGACGEIFNPTHHEKIQSTTYSDDVPADRAIREARRGYLLHDQIIRKAEVIVSKGQNIRTSEQLDQVVETYLNRLIASKFGPKYDLDKPTIKRKMAKYLSELDGEFLKKINSAATIDTTEYIKKQPLGNYCVGQATTHMCTDVVFRNFWKHMWEVVEQSKKTPKPKMKRAQPSVNKPPHTPTTQGNTSVTPSKKTVERTRIWDEVATAYETGAPVKGYIIERIQGGVQVSIGSLRGFLPASQVELHPIQNLEQYVGQTLEMKVISLSKRRHNIVLSRRAWLEAELVQKRSEVIKTLEVGQRVTGAVKNITNFGAFVDLGGVDGLIHKSEMAWKRINHPSQVVSVGEEVEVKVIKFDQENEKIDLSLKQMTSDPWENVEEKYPVGSTTQGIVTNIVNFGAFIQLEEGIEGLIHVSKMPLDPNNALPSDFLSKDNEVEVTVLEISKDSKRISLSIKSDYQNHFEENQVEISPDKPTSVVETESVIPNKFSEPTIIKPREKIKKAKPFVEELPSVTEVEKDYLGEPTNPIAPEPLQEVDDNGLLTRQDPDEILKIHIQELKSETLETETVSEPSEAANNDSQLDLQVYEDILSRQVQELKPETPEIENADNTMKELILETEVDNDTSVDSSAQTCSDTSTIVDKNAQQIKESDFSEDEIENRKKSFGYYLRRGRRFAVEKIKSTIFRKPTS